MVQHIDYHERIERTAIEIKTEKNEDISKAETRTEKESTELVSNYIFI